MEQVYETLRFRRQEAYDMEADVAAAEAQVASASAEQASLQAQLADLVRRKVGGGWGWLGGLCSACMCLCVPVYTCVPVHTCVHLLRGAKATYKRR